MGPSSITRRRFLASLAAVPPLAALGPPSPFSSFLSQSSTPTVDGARLRARLEALSLHGRPANGTFADGVSRVAYSEADLAGRRYVMELMKEARLAPRIDAAGNIVGRREGTGASLPPIVIGSHIDTVPNGGNFDGALGTLAAVEVASALDAARAATRHPIEVVVWTNEEGVAFGNGLCGSRAVAGEFHRDELDGEWNGLRMAEAVRAIGGDPARIDSVRRAPGSVHAYLELHIEQGGVLYGRGIPIGVVEGIVAIERHEVVVTGMANHAGTTPMPDRRDALVAASELVLAVREIVTSEPGRQVGTVGHLEVTPNAPNVVPGSVRLTVELRDLSEATIARMRGAIAARAAAIAQRTKTAIDMKPTSFHAAAPAHPAVQAALAAAAESLMLPSLPMPSGAGHDAQMLARIAPMGMIFVPSRDGISHSPKEATSWTDCRDGAAVLLGGVLAMDRTTVR